MRGAGEAACRRRPARAPWAVCEQVCIAGSVAGTRGHRPSRGCLPAGLTRGVAVHGWGTQVGRECSAAGGVSHRLWCCSGGRSIQGSTSYLSCGEQVSNAEGGLAVPAVLRMMRPVPSLQGRCADSRRATHEGAGVGRVFAGGTNAINREVQSDTKEVSTQALGSPKVSTRRGVARPDKAATGAVERCSQGQLPALRATEIGREPFRLGLIFDATKTRGARVVTRQAQQGLGLLHRGVQEQATRVIHVRLDLSSPSHAAASRRKPLVWRVQYMCACCACVCACAVFKKVFF